MHIYFSGIGGTGIGPLALIAHQAGYKVSGSDQQSSSYIDYLKQHGVKDIHIGQTKAEISAIHSKNKIDWFVYSSALPRDNPNHPELEFCKQQGIKTSLRDEFLNKVITDHKLKLIAIAGTHGKTTTTAMAIWLFKHLGIAASHSVGTKLSFTDMGHFDPEAKYFIYECDEYDKNLLSFKPYFSIITGVDWDHPDIYPTQRLYSQTFAMFVDQSSTSLLWDEDINNLGIKTNQNLVVLSKTDPQIETDFKLAGVVNRQDAWQVARAAQKITGKDLGELTQILNKFPGLSRRFEQIVPGLYSDYAHTPPKVRGALQLAQETAGNNVVVVYEGLHNTRQHFIKNELKNLFDDVKRLYIVPSYLAREDKNLEMLTPDKLLDVLSSKSREHGSSASLDDDLAKKIQEHLDNKELVLCLSAGGGGSLDEWLRKKFKN